MTADGIIALVHELERTRQERDVLKRRLSRIDPRLSNPDREDPFVLTLVAVAARHGVTVERLKYGGRSTSLSAVRHEAAWELRNLIPTPSYPDIAEALGMVNHTSALYGVRRHEARLRREAEAGKGTG